LLISEELIEFNLFDRYPAERKIVSVDNDSPPPPYSPPQNVSGQNVSGVNVNKPSKPGTGDISAPLRY